MASNHLPRPIQPTGILAAPFGPATERFTTHLDFTEGMLGRVVGVGRFVL